MILYKEMQAQQPLFVQWPGHGFPQYAPAPFHAAPTPIQIMASLESIERQVQDVRLYVANAFPGSIAGQGMPNNLTVLPQMRGKNTTPCVECRARQKKVNIPAVNEAYVNI